MAIDFEIIVGTYEQFLLGYKVQNVDSTYSLERSFATHSHLASIRAVASDRHYLASAGADDSVFLYDMRYRIESGRLMHHTDTVNCINFTPEASHIVTASSDGSIGIVRCGNWQLEKQWKSPHKGNPVNALAIHPTGKLAMSAGGDGVLRTWNLVKGRQAYATNLVPRLKLEAKNVTILRWSPRGDKYLLVTNSKLDVYSVVTAGLCTEMSFDSRVVCVEFVKNNILAIGHENGKIRFCDIAAGSSTIEIEAHDARVKCLVHKNNYLVSASSSGEIKLWRYNNKELNILSRTSCGARITCMTLAQPCLDLTVKREEIRVVEEMEKTIKNVFRMRQEVIIEDEADENKTNIAKGGENIEKKFGKKRLAEVSMAEKEFDDKSSKKKKNKKKKTNNKVVIVKDLDIAESSKNKKRCFSAEKSRDNPTKKTRQESTGRISKDAAEKIKNVDGNVSSIKSNEKKKKRRKIMIIEKPSKPVSTKRKSQNTISNVNTGFTPKTKKNKFT